jgi:hypothetical protein
VLRHTWCEIHILDSVVGAWKVGPNISAKVVLDLYQREIEWANATFAATPSHAAHAGLLDTVRELIDGKLWFALTN